MKSFEDAAKGDDSETLQERIELLERGSDLETFVTSVAVCLIGTRTRSNHIEMDILGPFQSADEASNAKDLYQDALSMALDVQQELKKQKNPSGGGFFTTEELLSMPLEKAWVLNLVAIIYDEHDLTPEGCTEEEGTRLLDETMAAKISEEDVEKACSIVECFEDDLSRFIENGMGQICSYLGWHHPLSEHDMYIAICKAQNDKVLLSSDLREWFPTYYQKVLDEVHTAENVPEALRNTYH